MRSNVIKASAYFSMTRKYINMMNTLSNLPKLCDDYEEFQTLKATTRKDFADSLDDNEIDAWLNSTYSYSYTWLLDLRTQEGI